MDQRWNVHISWHLSDGKKNPSWKTRAVIFFKSWNETICSMQLKVTRYNYGFKLINISSQAFVNGLTHKDAMQVQYLNQHLLKINNSNILSIETRSNVIIFTWFVCNVLNTICWAFSYFKFASTKYINLSSHSFYSLKDD